MSEKKKEDSGKTKKVTMIIGEDLWRRLHRASCFEERSKRDIVEEALSKYLKEKGTDNG